MTESAGPSLLERVLGAVPGTRRLPELTLPPLSVDEAKRARFETFTAEAKDRRGAEGSYDLPDLKHEYLRWLASDRPVLFHGSPGAPRDVLEARRATGVDTAGRQNAVYATPWPVMAMWFAVLNKSLRRFVYTVNGSRAVSAEDFSERAYWFKVNPGARTASVLTEGTVHVVDKSRFEAVKRVSADDDRQPSGAVRASAGQPLPAEPAIEWVCQGSVEPIHHVRVSPEDFPFSACVIGSEER